MDFNKLLSSFGNLESFDWSSILKNNDISRDVQHHLVRMYLALFACMCSSALGVYVNMAYQFGGHTASFFAAMGMLYWMNSDHNKVDTLRRTLMLCAFGFFKGLGLGSLVHMSLMIDPMLLPIALGGTMIIFLCFSMSALIAQRRSYFYLSGLISSGMMMLAGLSIMNMFFHSTQVYALQLYGGLVLFSGLVIVDTQMVVEKASKGSRDFAGHAADLFSNIFAIFAKVLIILMNKKNENDRANERNRKRR